MKISKKLSHNLLIAGFILIPLVVGTTASFVNSPGKLVPPQLGTKPTEVKEQPFVTYTPPTIPKKDVYIIFMVGDSMTEALGPYGSKMNEYLNKLYGSTPGNQRIVIDNYATGATNLLGLQDSMKQPKIHTEEKPLDPLLSRKFDVILIESFGYNPLSQLGVEEGLKKQTEILEETMKLLIKTHPDSVIVFVATIAPNKANYAKEVSLGESTAQRSQQAEERMAYIENHIAFAKEHNIPLIDIYSKSLTPAGDGDLKYINPNDHIHPSFEGVDFISNEIANFIYNNEILPR